MPIFRKELRLPTVLLAVVVTIILWASISILWFIFYPKYLFIRGFEEYYRGYHRSVKVISVEKGLRFCQIDEIQFQHPSLKGQITYSTEDDSFVSREFMAMRSNFLKVKNPVMGKGWTINIPFEQIQKVKFEKIPYTQIKLWPKSFPIEGIPEIKVDVKYRDGRENTYSAYATSWFYFYEKRL